MTLNYILFGIIGIWLAALTGIVVWEFIFFRRLSKNVNKGNLIKVLDKVFDIQKENSKRVLELEKGIANTNHEILTHVQKLGLVRFNPFGDMGGDHSFSLALLDGEDTGIIITGLHTRDRTRVYIKDISHGNSAHSLSKEEEKALKKALK